MRRFNTAFGILIAAGGMAYIAVASAAQQVRTPEGGMGYKLGAGMRLAASMESEFRQSDNFYYQSKGAGRQESALGVILKPGLHLSVDRGRLRYSVTGGVESGNFDRSGDRDDFVDSVVGADVSYDLTGTQSVKGRVNSQRGHDAFGAVRSENLALSDRELDQWRTDLIGAEYHFGTPASQLNLEFAAQALERTYLSNQAQTNVLDHHTDTLRSTGFYRLGARTAVIGEVIYSDTRYDEAVSALVRDGSQTLVRGGLRWLATSKTTGDIRVGKVFREFDNSTLSSYDDLNWEANLSWSVRPYSVFNFSSGWLSYEGYSSGVQFIETKYYGVQWRHDWSSRLASIAAVRYDDATFVGAPNGRKDDTYNYQFGLEFRPALTWMLFGRADSFQRESNEALRDYDENRLSVGIRVTP